MALGGGIFTRQDKVLPGAYINTVSKHYASDDLGKRGVVAWFLKNWNYSFAPTPRKIKAVEAKEKSLAIFGYSWDDEKMQAIRDVFKEAKEVIFYTPDKGSAATGQAYEVKTKGTRGNEIQVAIENLGSSNTVAPKRARIWVGDVLVYDKVHTEKLDGDNKWHDDNPWVLWKDTYSTNSTFAKSKATGGRDESGNLTTHDEFLKAIESLKFNVLLCDDHSQAALYKAYTLRMRKEVGKKFQTVFADVEANTLNDESLVCVKPAFAMYYIAGAMASCPLGESLLNKKYEGYLANEKLILNTQSDLEDCIEKGYLAIHWVENEPRILADINTLTTFTTEKNKYFAKNQTIRVLDQIAEDIAKIFSTRYLGKIPNDANGRVSLKMDIVKHHLELEKLRAIEDFEIEDVNVLLGSDAESVVVHDRIKIVNAMAKMYMTIMII